MLARSDAARKSGLWTPSVREVHAVVADWRKTAQKLHIPARALGAYASAFEHPLMDEAAKLH